MVFCFLAKSIFDAYVHSEQIHIVVGHCMVEGFVVYNTTVFILYIILLCAILYNITMSAKWLTKMK